MPALFVPMFVILDLKPAQEKRRGRFLEELRSDPTLRKIPVVIFSSSRSNRDIVRSYELGANCYLSKPVGLSEFVFYRADDREFLLPWVTPDSEEGRRKNGTTRKRTYC